MTTDRVVVREVDWRSLCPWLILFRTFRIAIAIPVLLLGTIGAALTPLGWQIGRGLFLDEEALAMDADLATVIASQQSWPSRPGMMPVPYSGRVPMSVREILQTPVNTLEPIYHQGREPIVRLMSGRLTVTQAAYYVFGLLWMLAVWGFFGGAINRIAIIWLGRDERIGVGQALRHARRRFLSYFASPLFPLFGILLTVIPIAIAGWCLRLDAGVLVIGLAWLFILVGGLVIMLFLLGLTFGWPLMWGAISAEENGDAFEAFSRSYSYTFQRPLQYLLYAAIATAFGGLCWLLVFHFSEALIGVSDWAAMLGAGEERWSEIAAVRFGAESDSGTLNIGAAAIEFWHGVVRTMASGFNYSFFWCVAAAMYLLLRKSCDRAEFDKIYVEHFQATYALPEIEMNSPPAGEGGAESPATNPPSDSPPEGSAG